MMLAAQCQMLKEAGENYCRKRQARSKDAQWCSSMPSVPTVGQLGEEQQEPPRGGEVLFSFLS